MAVTILTDWAGLKSGSPTGSATFGSSSDRVLFMVYMAERAASLTYTSITIGGEAPDGEVIAESSTTSVSAEQYIWAWYWEEATLAAMTSTGISLSKSATPANHVWDYITFAGAGGGAEFNANTVEASATNTSITSDNATSVNDFLVVMANRSADARNITAWDNLTEGWQHNTNFTAGVADGSGGDDTVSITGDGFSGDWMVALLRLISAGATGTPAITMKHLHEVMLK